MPLDLRKALFILPNLLTLASVFCGFYAIVLCGELRVGAQSGAFRAALLILFAMLFDTIDGRVARLTRTQSALGVQLDSLADVISFGVAPALLVFRWGLEQLQGLGLFAAFLYTACGTVRLARFNVLSTDAHGAPKLPSKYIQGLPIPAAAGLLVAVVLADASLVTRFQPSPVLLLALTLTLAFLMVSRVRFRSFKDLRPSLRTVGMVSFAVGISVALALRYHISIALMWLLGSYVAIALIEALRGSGKVT
ncbi:MAG: CDP-diacylglycerol--serine O-phosphatidyltransferase [Polyangiales bacterium]